MSIQNTLLTLLSFFLFTSLVNAQNHHRCGMSHAEGALIKDRLLQNKRSIHMQEAIASQNARNTIYVPVTLFNIGNSSGAGFTDENFIMDVFCGLNAMYNSQNIRFYLKDTVIRVKNDVIYNDAKSISASWALRGLKKTNTVNVFITPSINNATASFYSPFGDYVVLLNSMMTAEAKTFAHELGHFFTIPHTFYGWEGTDVHATYGAQGFAPSSINGSTVEYARRTGSGTNCDRAADTFCDTEADYYSDRVACPMNPIVTDPLGDAIDPDETNIMSYFLDQCVNDFTSEQSISIKASISQRGIGYASCPYSTTVYSETDINNTFPVANQAVNPNVAVTWDVVPGVIGYYVEIVGTFFGNPRPSDVIYRKVIWGSANNTVNLTGLTVGKTFAWRIRPIGHYSTCSATTTWEKFRVVATNTTDVEFNQLVEFNINPNPVKSIANFDIYSAETMSADLEIFGINGQKVAALNNEVLNKGENTFSINTATLESGFYIAVLRTEKGMLRKKILVQK